MPTSENGSNSSLDQRPEYVHAIGMISIEHGRLELVLANLLGILLKIETELGNALYFTPKAATARLDLIKNTVEISTVGKTDLVKKVRAVLKRSREVMGKRNDIIHSLWSVNEEEDADAPIIKLSFPDSSDSDVTLQQLKNIVSEYRRLMDDVGKLIGRVLAEQGFEPEEPEDLPHTSR